MGALADHAIHPIQFHDWNKSVHNFVVQGDWDWPTL